MRADKLGYFLVGLFVIVAITGLIAVLGLLGGRGAESVRYHTTYENVAGLKFGTPVFFEGFLAGQIEQISPIAGGTRTIFRIDFSVLEALKIPADSEVLIVQPNLLSGRALTIDAGKSDADIEPGAYHVTLSKLGYTAKRVELTIGDGQPIQFRLLSDQMYGFMWPKWVRTGESSEYCVHSTESFRLDL